MRDEQFFERLEAYMLICDIENDAIRADEGVPDNTWYVRTPEGFSPVVRLYFTYLPPSDVRLEAVYGED